MAKKTRNLNIRLEDEQLERARVLAKMRGMSLSRYTRWALVENVPPAFMDEVKQEKITA